MGGRLFNFIHENLTKVHANLNSHICIQNLEKNIVNGYSRCPLLVLARAASDYWQYRPGLPVSYRQ